MTDRQFQIGDFIVEPLAGRVCRADDISQSTHLQPMVMKVLVCLADRQGDVVKRDDLIELVWGRPVTDEVLTRAIHELRVVLQDRDAQDRYVETIPKVGYRLLAAVRPIGETASMEDVSPDAPGLSPSALGWAFRVVTGIVIVLALFAAVVMLSDDGTNPEEAESRRVVLARFENHTDDSRLEGALDIAFRTGIEQSAQISIYPPSLLSSVLERMQRDPESPVNRDTAIEISRRENADRVIVGAIASVGDSFRVTGEIIEPETGETIFTHQSAVVGEDKILQGLDDVVAAIRKGAGETESAIEASSVPLERVTTANFEALEAYSIGMQKTGIGDLGTAVSFFREAIRLDPEFAMAYAKLGLVQFVASDVNPEARLNLQRALELSDRLTRREQRYVSGLISMYGTPEDMVAAWSLLVLSFPQHGDGHRILGNVYMLYELDFEKAEEYLKRSIELPDPTNAVAHHNLGMVLLAQNRYESALEHFQIAWDMSGTPMSAGLALAHISTGHYAAAEEFVRENSVYPSDNMRQYLELVSAIAYMDQGLFRQARALAVRAGDRSPGELGSRQRSLVSQCAILERTESTEEFVACLRELIDLDMSVFEPGTVPRRYWPSANLALLGIVAARNGRVEDAASIFSTIESHARQSGLFPIRSYLAILEAELLMAEGEYDEAVRLLEAQITDRSLYQAHESLARAHLLAGDTASATREYLWLTENRGLAIAHPVSRRFGNEFHILDWAVAHVSLGQLYEQAGKPDEAIDAYQALVQHWAHADEGIPSLDFARDRLAELRQQ